MANTSLKNYNQLHQISKHIKTLSGIGSLLGWDQETYMPPAGASIRAEQIKTIAGLVHKELTGKKFAAALDRLIDLETGELKAHDLDDKKKAALKEWRREYIKETALPAKFVEDFAQLASQGQLAWRQAKKENSFQQFAPFLDKIIIMNRRKADYLGYQDHPYDALLDLYEPEMTSKEISLLFNHLRKEITPLINKISKATQVDDSFLFGEFDADRQIEMGKRLLKDMGYEFEKGRLDLSSHPFSSACHPYDSRVTTRIHPSSLMSNISVVLHEGGHGMYEMGLPVEEYGSPLCEAISLGIHESQSRWWETRIGQSIHFWKFYLPILKNQFKNKLEKVSLEDFYRAINKVEPSFIRVEADEVTYSMHVILRYELEVALIEGSLNVRDVPEAWNSTMQELLGITPHTNAEGCLQDIHWSMGAFGYFPTYTLGNLYASHLFKAFEKEFPKWGQKVESGNLIFIKEWLHNNVYQHGKGFTSKELLKHITNKDFTAEAYVKYIKDKYNAIYKI